ncbi:hypothetical protein ACHQM5_029559 [Ranunculus cassubicifolius]
MATTMNVHEIQIEKYGVTLIDGLGTDFILTSRQGRGDTFLSSAACTDHLNCCEEIYRRCPSLLYICNDLGETPLHRAVISNKAKNVSFFLTAGNEEHILTGRRRRMYNKELMMMADNMGKTALHRAAELGLREIVELFLHADKPGYELLKMEDWTKETAFQSSMAQGKLEMVKFMMETVPASLMEELLLMVDINYSSVLHKAVTNDNHEMLKFILKADHTKELLGIVDGHRNSAMHLAVKAGKYEMVKTLLEADTNIDYFENNNGETPLLASLKVSGEIRKLLLEKGPKQSIMHRGENRWTILHHAVHIGNLGAVQDIIGVYPSSCEEVDKEGQNFLHLAAKFDNINVVKYILTAKGIPPSVLNMQDKDGNTPLHIAGISRSENTVLCLLDDRRVSKLIENKNGQKAVNGITFEDEAKGGVYNLGHQRDLKDQSSFDLVVAALIATVSFTAGITVPGGFTSEGPNKGTAVLSKVTAFKAFVVSNNIALLFSLYTVFLNFSTRRLLKKEDLFYEPSLATFRTRLLLKKEDIIYQLNVATLCILGAIQAMVVAFITGSYAVLGNLDGLAITVCVCSSCFFVVASHAVWNMVVQYRRSVL